MDSPLFVIFEMVVLIISNTISTFGGIIGLFGKLAESLGIVSSVGGPIGFVISVIILGTVGFFIAKLFLGGGKKLVILVPLAIIVLFLITLGSIV